MRFGGKGINVSRRLKEMGVQSKALGFIGGFTGEELERSILDEGIAAAFVRVKSGYTRINIKLKDKNSVETEINTSTIEVNDDEVNKLLSLLSHIGKEDTVVLSGSFPRGAEILDRLCSLVSERGAELAADVAGKRLLDILKYRPVVIKPNLSELEALYLGENAIYKLKEMGAKNILLSRGAQGAALLDEENRFYEVPAPKGKIVTTVGCGDCMLAAFLKYRKIYNGAELLNMCVRTASLAAFGEKIGP